MALSLRRLFARLRGHESLAALQQVALETKGGVSNTQSQVGEIYSHLVVLRRELAELKSVISDTNGRLAARLQSFEVTRTASVAAGPATGADSQAVPSPLYNPSDILGLPKRLDELAGKCLGMQSAEADKLCQYYVAISELVDRYWVKGDAAPQDPHADDDFSLDYALRNNVFVPGPGNEASILEDAPRLPWRHLFEDPDCGVFFVIGQSNGANHGESTHVAKNGVYNFDFLRLRCTQAADPLGGASGDGGSVWSRLGDLLVERGVFQRVLFIPVAFGGSFIRDWIPGGNKQKRMTLAVSRLAKELGGVVPFSGVLWQQGEAEANHTQMSSAAYSACLYDVLADLRNMGVFAPAFIAKATVCEAGPHPFQNRDEIRDAQTKIVNPANGIFAGPDVDVIGKSGRYDGCHLSEDGLQKCAELWFEVIAESRSLLFKMTS